MDPQNIDKSDKSYAAIAQRNLDSTSADSVRKALDDPRSTAELIEQALAHFDYDDYDDEQWDAIWLLEFRGTPDVFDAARALLADTDPHKRQLGVIILGQLGIPERTFLVESVGLLLSLLEHEENTDVLCDIGTALGHLDDPRAIEPLSRFKDHPHEDVRYGVVHGMSGHVNMLAIDTLIDLSSDVDDDVRDWATFGLGAILCIYAEDEPFFTPDLVRRVCDALYARIDDSHEDTRFEALEGLAEWKDERVIEPLIAELHQKDTVPMVALEAATTIADSRLCPALLVLKERWKDDEPDSFTKELDDALVACGCAGESKDAPMNSEEQTS